MRYNPIPHDLGPEAPRPPPDRPDGPSGAAAPGHRRRPGGEPPHRQPLDQRLLRRRTRRSGATQAPGHPAHISDDLADEVRRWVIEGPPSCGLDRANWTHAELADHLSKPHGIATSRSAVQRFCRRIDIRPYRPTYRHLRGDPARQAKAKEDLADLGQGPRPGNSSC
jgi:transposase